MKSIKLSKNGEPAVAQPQVLLAAPYQTGNEILPRDAVALQAYLTYVRQGRPEGCDVQHWLEAEARTLSTGGPR